MSNTEYTMCHFTTITTILQQAMSTQSWLSEG